MLQVHRERNICSIGHFGHLCFRRPPATSAHIQTQTVVRRSPSRWIQSHCSRTLFCSRHDRSGQCSFVHHWFISLHAVSFTFITFSHHQLIHCWHLISSSLLPFVASVNEPLELSYILPLFVFVFSLYPHWMNERANLFPATGTLSYCFFVSLFLFLFLVSRFNVDGKKQKHRWHSRTHSLTQSDKSTSAIYP